MGHDHTERTVGFEHGVGPVATDLTVDVVVHLREPRPQAHVGEAARGPTTGDEQCFVGPDAVRRHAVRRVEITDARLNGKYASITVRFTADETYVMRAGDGTVTLGNPDRVSEAVDIWTFSRDLRARSPAWLVSETRDADHGDSANLAIPDSV